MAGQAGAKIEITRTMIDLGLDEFFKHDLEDGAEKMLVSVLNVIFGANRVVIHDQTTE
tara:strand:+ start:2011 stop:2184 length:174 start_codon:yes stop_codon:yes gene_type:complete